MFWKKTNVDVSHSVPQLGTLICRQARSFAEKVDTLDIHSPGFVKLECLAFVRWFAFATIKDSSPGPTSANLEIELDQYLRKKVANITDSELRCILYNRQTQYSIAAADSSGVGPLYNVAKLFLACCGTKKNIVYYDRLLPDSQELEDLKDFMTPGVYDKFKEIQENEEVTTYSIDPIPITNISSIMFDLLKILPKEIERNLLFE